MKRLLGALAFVGVAATASSAMAQEIQIRGPLAGAPACRRCTLYRSNRFSIAPTVGITLVDPYERVLFVGGQATYHITDGVGIGLWGAGGVAHINTGLTNSITSRLSEAGVRPTPNIPQGSAFPEQIGRLNWLLMPQITLVPLRGKLALFQNIFVDTDFYVFGGLALAGVTERANFPGPGGGDPRPLTGTEPEIIMNQRERSSRVAVTGTFGFGLNFYINRFISLSFEYRAFPFSWNTMGTDESSTQNVCGENSRQSCAGFPDYQVDPNGSFVIDGNDRSFRFNQMVNFGINFFLPTAPRVSP